MTEIIDLVKLDDAKFDALYKSRIEPCFASNEAGRLEAVKQFTSRAWIGGNLFEPGDLFKPLVDPARARRIVDEIAGVVRVMDQVLTAQAQRPPTQA